MSPLRGSCGGSPGSAAQSRCWCGYASNARWENRSRSAFSQWTNSLIWPLITSSFSCTIFSDIVCCLLSNVCVVTSFYQTLQAMSSFMLFSICASYCTLSRYADLCQAGGEITLNGGCIVAAAVYLIQSPVPNQQTDLTQKN